MISLTMACLIEIGRLVSSLLLCLLFQPGKWNYQKQICYPEYLTPFAGILDMKSRNGKPCSDRTSDGISDISSLAAIWLIAMLAGGLTPILAFLISLLGDKLGIAAWAWIFVGSYCCRRETNRLF